MAERITEVEIKTVKIDSDIYPRTKPSTAQVKLYRQNLDNLPPIEITKEHYLVDGYHRILAHKAEKKDLIKALIIEIPRNEVLWESTKRNSKHGLSLNRKEKTSLAKKFFEQGKTIDEISDTVGVSKSKLYYLTKDNRQKEKQKAIDMILDFNNKGKSPKEILAELKKKGVKLSLSKITRIIQNSKLEKRNDEEKPAKQTDKFDVEQWIMDELTEMFRKLKNKKEYKLGDSYKLKDFLNVVKEVIEEEQGED